jgi:prepilin-type N-terminal cleavage/methylation domain-containing protein
VESRQLRKNKGFSLLELVITVAILAVGIVAILQALTYSIKVTGTACDTVRAVFLAEDLAQELEFKEKNNLLDKVSSDHGEVDKFKWNYDLSVNPGQNVLYDLELAVSWQRLNRSEKVELFTWLYPQK